MRKRNNLKLAKKTNNIFVCIYFKFNMTHVLADSFILDK